MIKKRPNSLIINTIFIFITLITLILSTIFFPSTPYARQHAFPRTNQTDPFLKGPFLRLGFGYGIPYGYLGLNGEYMIFKYLSLSGGLGYTPGGSGWITGLRVYFNEPYRRLRPRISIMYGTVSVLSKKYGAEDVYETDQGYAYGLGAEWKLFDTEKHSIDFDLIMTDYDVPPGYEKKGPKIKFSVGYGRIF